ncbi:MAG: hypothetical protein DVB31_02945 [Verrucomicrobia bacterium]|nr:MAG: hypothetical protein DVB31_02945 [Verrucomicrobiota bacterium]
MSSGLAIIRIRTSGVTVLRWGSTGPRGPKGDGADGLASTAISDSTATGRALITAADPEAAHVVLELGSAALADTADFDAAGEAAAAYTAAIAAAGTDATAKASAAEAAAIAAASTDATSKVNAAEAAAIATAATDATAKANAAQSSANAYTDAGLAAKEPTLPTGTDVAIVRNGLGAWVSKTATDLKSWLGIGLSDVSGLVSALAAKVDTGDSRLSNARTPTTHASTHAAAGSDPLTLAASQVSGLGGAALLSVGTGAGTVAAGDDSRVTGAAQKSANLSDLASAATARSNLGAAPTASPTFTGPVTLDGFVLDVATYTAQTFARIIATNAATNVNVVLAPKGGGYLSLRMPDGTATGGNQRGANAVDFTWGGTVADRVASGAGAVAYGYNAKASGASSIAIGDLCVATNSNAVAIGYGCSATGGADVAIGNQNTASGGNSFACGVVCTSSGAMSFSSGYSSQATASYSFASGFQSLADKLGQRAHAAGVYASRGDCQGSELVARNVTTDATPTELFLDGSSARMVVPANTLWNGLVQVSARTNTAGGQDAAWLYFVRANRGVAVGTIVVTATLLASSGSNGGAPPSGWAAAIDNDTTNGSLRCKGTGAAATTIRWGLVSRKLEVGFP